MSALPLARSSRRDRHPDDTAGCRRADDEHRATLRASIARNETGFELLVRDHAARTLADFRAELDGAAETAT